MQRKVAMTLCQRSSEKVYPEFPYGPGEYYPELPGGQLGPPNPVYAAVRKSLRWLGLDPSNLDTPRWNPFDEIIRPGDQVLIKPNWVLHASRSGGDTIALVTHSSVIRPIIDYVLLALQGQGKIIIGDAPIQSADFDEIVAHTRIKQLVERISSGEVEISVRDFRQNICKLDGKGRVIGHRSMPGDPAGYCIVNLGGESLLSQVSQESWRFRVTNYDPTAMRRHHEANRHEYLIARAMLESQVVIGVPKLKTHRKAGMTCCLKNMVGINGSKDYLPHHRIGATKNGGDEYLYPSYWKSMASRIADYLDASPGSPFRGITRFALRLCHRMAHYFAEDPYYEGSWYGNDTIWRTVMDLNRILKFARPDGTLSDLPCRRIFHIVDAIVAGAGEGPLCPDPVNVGIILAGEEAAAVDALAARLVGLDPKRIPLLEHAIELMQEQDGSKSGIRIFSDNDQNLLLGLDRIQPLTSLIPPAGWVGHIELTTA